MDFKCSSCGFVTEVKVHVDCVNANSLVTEDESSDKEDSKNIAPTSQDSTQQGTVSSNESTPTENVKVIDNETNNEKNFYRSENYPLYIVSDIIGKSLYSFAKLGVDILSVSSKLSSVYYEQYLQYEKMWSYYWTETYRSFNAFSHRSDESPRTDAI
ncbi:MAG: hypothetical protein WBV84_03770 [Nitrososphaeraceae archaeon]